MTGTGTESLLLIQSASNISVIDLKIDTANQNNSPGYGRYGIAVWNSKVVTISHVTCVNNLGKKVYNQGISLNQSTDVTVDNCEISYTRTGVFIWECSDFSITRCEVYYCEPLLPPNFTGGAITITASSGGSVSDCYIHDNHAYGGIFVIQGSGVLIDSCRIYRTLPFPTQPGNDGIYVIHSKGNPVVVHACELLDNSGSGISADRSVGVIIKENAIVNSGTLGEGGSGVSINGGTQGVIVTGNKISDDRNPDYPGIIAGFNLADGTDSGGLVSKNVVHGFGYCGVQLASYSRRFKVAHNDLRNNTQCVVNQGKDNHVSGNRCS